MSKAVFVFQGQGDKLVSGSAVHYAELVPVEFDLLRVEAEASVLHSAGQEKLGLNEFLEIPPGDALDDFGQNEPGGSCVVASLLSGSPVWFERRCANTDDHLIPGKCWIELVGGSKSPRMCEEIFYGDRLFAACGKFRNDAGDALANVEFLSFVKESDGNGRDRFSGGKPKHQGFGLHRSAGTGFAESCMGDNCAAMAAK